MAAAAVVPQPVAAAPAGPNEPAAAGVAVAAAAIPPAADDVSCSSTPLELAAAEALLERTMGFANRAHARTILLTYQRHQLLRLPWPAVVAAAAAAAAPAAGGCGAAKASAAGSSKCLAPLYAWPTIVRSDAATAARVWGKLIDDVHLFAVPSPASGELPPAYTPAALRPRMQAYVDAAAAVAGRSASAAVSEADCAQLRRPPIHALLRALWLHGLAAADIASRCDSAASALAYAASASSQCPDAALVILDFLESTPHALNGFDWRATDGDGNTVLLCAAASCASAEVLERVCALSPVDVLHRASDEHWLPLYAALNRLHWHSVPAERIAACVRVLLRHAHDDGSGVQVVGVRMRVQFGAGGSADNPTANAVDDDDDVNDFISGRPPTAGRVLVVDPAAWDAMYADNGCRCNGMRVVVTPYEFCRMRCRMRLTRNPGDAPALDALCGDVQRAAARITAHPVALRRALGAALGTGPAADSTAAKQQQPQPLLGVSPLLDLVAAYVVRPEPEELVVPPYP